MIINNSIPLIGGPEAALDSLGTLSNILNTSSTLNYVPSYLCGMLGLICTLEESLGIKVDISNHKKRLKSRILEILNSQLHNNTTFHKALFQYLEIK